MDIPSVTGGWQVVYADPPWRFASNSTSKPGRNARRHYPVMTVSEIAAMPVASVTAKDALLLLWITAPLADRATEVIHGWGFRYKSQVVWDKLMMGTGYWARNQHEILLIATRGQFPCPRPLFPSSIIRERRREHSRKPILVREILDAKLAEYRRLELFARSESPGWTAWGNETGKLA